MIKLNSIIINQEHQSDFKRILVDDDDFLKFDCINKELVIRSDFPTTQIQSILLKIAPDPEKEIQCKLYNIDINERETNIKLLPLIKFCSDENYAIYNVNCQINTPYCHLEIKIKSEKYTNFKIYFFRIEGNRIIDEEEKEQLRIQEQKDEDEKFKKSQKSNYKSGRNQDKPLLNQSEFTFETFIKRVKEGKSIQFFSNYNTETTEKQQIKPNTQTNTEILIEDDVELLPKPPDTSKDCSECVQIVIDEENSQKALQNSEKSGKTIVQNRQYCFSDKPKIYNTINNNQQVHQKTNSYQQSTQKGYNNQYYKKSYQDDNQMINFLPNDIDQQFLIAHESMEKQFGIKWKERLIHRLTKNLE